MVDGAKYVSNLYFGQEAELIASLSLLYHHP